MATETADLKACCAAFYAEPAVRAFFAEVLHPGGLTLTSLLGEALRLGSGARVLDVACGPGRSARHLRETFGWRVTGIDYSHDVLPASRDGEWFVVGDAEGLPFGPARFDGVVVECSFCLFPDKAGALAEARRVLRPGGRLGITDLALERALPPDLPPVLAWVACMRGAQSGETYRRLIAAAGFEDIQVLDHSDVLMATVLELGQRMFWLEVAAGLGKISNLPVGPAEARRWLGEAQRWIVEGAARYLLVTARAP